jgi:hypothetical protein
MNAAGQAARLSARRTAPRAAHRAARRTWFVLGVAFAIWCALLAATLTWAVTVRRYAMDTPIAELTVESGTVFYQGPDSPRQERARQTLAVREGGAVEVGDGGRATLRLLDGSTVALLPHARLELRAHRIGRFSAEQTAISLELSAGAARLDVAGGLPSGRDLVVATPVGPVGLSAGSYLVSLQEDGVRVLSYAGRAWVGDEGTLRVQGGQRAVVSSDGRPRGPFTLAEDLIVNGDFADQLREWTPFDRAEPGRPDVGGSREFLEDTVAGRKIRALRITRDSPRDAFNETGIVQKVDRDVSAYRTLAITAWVKVNYASLSGGGYLGSEYPLMFRVNYSDKRGGRPGWTRGFYYANPENRPTTNGEAIARGEWVPYVARLSDLPDRPAFIDSVEVLSAGHDFDAMVADIRLTVE